MSQDTLKDEMFRLIDLTVYETLSTIEYLVYDYDPSAPSLRDSVINHVAENTWECTLKYRVEGERLYRASENPLVCKKQSLKVSQNSPLKGEYCEMFDQDRCTWSYCSLVKPDWVE